MIFKKFLIRENVNATIFTDFFNYELLNKKPPTFLQKLNSYKQSIFERLKEKINNKIFFIFSSIFLGKKIANKKLSDKYKNSFKLWGLSHYLARSGLHLIIVILLLEILCSLLPIPFFIKQLILLCFGIGYSCLTWISVSFSRALSSFVLYKICLISNLSVSFLNILCLVSLITLLCNPILLFFLDFQLSFGITFALAMAHTSQAKTNNIKKLDH